MEHKVKSWKERFWRKVKKGEGCWLWIGGKTSGGYGEIQINGKKCYAHRVSWQLFNREIPRGLYVLHHCDNPPCVNPNHLFIGTQSINILDANNKGRAKPPIMKGEDHACAKLTLMEVREIRKLYQEGQTNKTKIAKLYGVSDMNIFKIINRKTWRDYA